MELEIGQRYWVRTKNHKTADLAYEARFRGVAMSPLGHEAYHFDRIRGSSAVALWVHVDRLDSALPLRPLL